MLEDILPEFQKFLLSRKLVPEKNVFFYAHWADRFLAFSNNNKDLNQNLRIAKFIDSLKTQKNIADWQIRQAEEAVRLYVDRFPDCREAVPAGSPGPVQSAKIYSDLPQILGKMREMIRIKHYSYRTERSYTDWARRFHDYVTGVKKKDVRKSDPDSNDVKDFLSHLAIKQRVSSSTQNQAFNALLFLFRDVLGTPLDGIDSAVRAKRGPKLPVVLGVDEVRELFKHANGKYMLVLQLLYGSGLRLMEAARLRVMDIDFDAGLLLVRSGKGDKDRSTMLPERVKDNLRRHLEEVKALHMKDIEAGYGEVYLPDALERKYPNAAKDWRWQYVFPASNLSADSRSGKIRRHHIGEKSIQNIVTAAARRANIPKHVTVHTLRHSFATHLLKDGVNIREIQELLGHKNVETTMIYTHVLRDMASAPKSPLDNLWRMAGEGAADSSRENKHHE